MRKIGIGAFLVNALVYLGIVGFVFAVLYRGFVLDLNQTLFGVKIHQLVYVVPLAYLAYLTQRNLSAAHGVGRFLDFIVSISMLIVIFSGALLWAGIPIFEEAMRWVSAKTGVVLASSPSEYNLAVALLFGVVALLDVLGRDMFGFFRGGSGMGIQVGSDSVLEVSARPRVKLDAPWELELPNGRVLPFTPPEHMLRRFEDEVTRRLPKPDSPPAAAGV